jgi:hypothetical protein
MEDPLRKLEAHVGNSMGIRATESIKYLAIFVVGRFIENDDVVA